MSEDSQVCDLHSQMHVCSCTRTDCTIAFVHLPFGCAGDHTLKYFCLCVHYIMTCLPASPCL